MLEYEFQLKSLNVVFFPPSDTLHGPSSKRRPVTELQPGPPLSHKVNGALLGARLDSKNLSDGECMRHKTSMNIPEEEMFPIRYIKISRMLFDGIVA